jgi:hypothetical protein
VRHSSAKRADLRDGRPLATSLNRWPPWLVAVVAARKLSRGLRKHSVLTHDVFE